MVFHDLQCIYVHIPKTGGTSICNALDPSYQINTEDSHEKHWRAEDYAKHFPDEWERYYKFAFVRDPWDWAYSMFHWHRTYNSSLKRHSWWTRTTRRKHRSFRYFVRTMQAPWQLDFLTIDGEIAVDFVGHFENLETEFSEVIEALGKRLGPDATLPDALPHLNALPHEHYSAHYTSDIRENVAQQNRAFIERYGYAFKENN